MITIAWDIDDVLNDLMKSWFENHWLPSHRDCSLTYDALFSNPPHRILGVAQSVYLASLDEFRLSIQYTEMEPMIEVVEWFELHGNNFRHMALTAVPLKAAHQSAYWITSNFGKWIKDYHFIPSFREGENLPKYDASKQEVLKRLNFVDIFIDDTEKNLTGVDKLGVKPFLFPRPWNKNKQKISELLEEMTEYAYTLTKSNGEELE